MSQGDSPSNKKFRRSLFTSLFKRTLTIPLKLFNMKQCPNTSERKNFFGFLNSLQYNFLLKLNSFTNLKLTLV